jgi:hypothetical protein
MNEGTDTGRLTVPKALGFPIGLVSNEHPMLARRQCLFALNPPMEPPKLQILRPSSVIPLPRSRCVLRSTDDDDAGENARQLSGNRVGISGDSASPSHHRHPDPIMDPIPLADLCSFFFSWVRSRPTGSPFREIFPGRRQKRRALVRPSLQQGSLSVLRLDIKALS